MNLLDRFRRKKREDETAHIARLLQNGRIVEGRVIDVGTDAEGNITQVFYCYEIGGVQYESSQLLNPEQQRSSARYIPGASVTIRYDPRQPANSALL
jgi:hypothetical protein